MSALSSASMPTSHRGVSSSSAKSTIDKFFDVLETIMKVIKVALHCVGLLAIVFNICYSSEIVGGLMAIGVPFFPSVILNLAITYLFLDYFRHSKLFS